jgi:hypothetical protein
VPPGGDDRGVVTKKRKRKKKFEKFENFGRIEEEEEEEEDVCCFYLGWVLVSLSLDS